MLPCFLIMGEKEADMKNDIIQNIRLDMNAPKIKSSLSVRLGDTCTRSIHVTLSNGGSVVSMENALVALIEIEKPDGNHCYNDCVISGNEIQYTITTQTINVEGTCKCQINVTFEHGAIVSSPVFDLVVYSQLVDQNEVKSQNEYSALTEQVVMANDYANNAKLSADAAGVSETNAKESEIVAKESEQNADTSANEAARSAQEALESKEAATVSEENAALSENNAKQYKDEAEQSAQKALASETSAGKSASAASVSETNAKISETNATKSADAAGVSEANAKKSENIAMNKATDAGNYAAEAKGYLEDLEASGILTLGYGHENAMYGDQGKKAYDHSLSVENPHNTTYAQVGADKEGLAQSAYENAVAYTDRKVADLINGAPETLDTLKEIADAMEAEHTVVEALDEAIGKKANQSEFNSHESNEVIHITANERTMWNAYAQKLSELEQMITELQNKQGYPV